MSKVKWDKFRIGDLFELIPTKILPYKASECAKEPAGDYLLPVLTAGIENQGLSRYIPYDGATVLKDCVSVSANGANTGSMFYQDEDFTVLQDAYAIKLKNYEGSREVYLFLISCMQKVIKGNFDWSNKAKWMRVKDLLISIPVTFSGDPDFSYMEERISELEEERISELEAYLTASGLDDYELTDEDKKILNKMKNGEKEFGKFNYTDFFKLLPIHHKVDKLAFSEKGIIPAYSSDTRNNGILGYVDMNPEFKVSDRTPVYLIFGDHTRTMNLVYNNFCVMDNVKVLKPLQLFSEDVLLYLTTAWKKTIPNIGYARHWSIAKNAKFKLPITSSGSPDYEWMELYIRAMEKKVIGKLYEYRRKEIDTAKEVFKNNQKGEIQ